MDKPSDRFFLDTGYVIARFNRRDEYHQKAQTTGQLGRRWSGTLDYRRRIAGSSRRILESRPAVDRTIAVG